jgi:c-di-GMP-binding flagellar brake protein YcgR
MTQRRKHKRTEVNLPIYCKFADLNKGRTIASIGKVSDLSICGMKVKVPIQLQDNPNSFMDYFLELPKPYRQIRGQARIVWAYWDDQNQTTEIGMEMTTLDSIQRSDLETILGELNSEKFLAQ